MEEPIENTPKSIEVDLIKKKKKKRKKSSTDQTFYRSMLSNLVRQTHIADQKAALMISVNSVIISFIVSFVATKVTEMEPLIYPTILLLAVCLLVIVFSILATRPRVENSVKNERDMLFFGHFDSYGQAEYIDEVIQLVSKESLLQEKIISSIYKQGKVMNRKYSNLRLAYNIFMFGFPISILSYVLALFYSF